MSEDQRIDGRPGDDVEGQVFRASPASDGSVRRRPRDDARGKGPRPGLDEAEDDVADHAARPPMRPIEASP